MELCIFFNFSVSNLNKVQKKEKSNNIGFVFFKIWCSYTFETIVNNKNNHDKKIKYLSFLILFTSQWKYNIRKNAKSRFSITTVHKFGIIFLNWVW